MGPWLRSCSWPQLSSCWLRPAAPFPEGRQKPVGSVAVLRTDRHNMSADLTRGAAVVDRRCQALQFHFLKIQCLLCLPSQMLP